MNFDREAAAAATATAEVKECCFSVLIDGRETEQQPTPDRNSKNLWESKKGKYVWHFKPISLSLLLTRWPLIKKGRNPPSLPFSIFLPSLRQILSEQKQKHSKLAVKRKVKVCAFTSSSLYSSTAVSHTSTNLQAAKCVCLIATPSDDDDDESDGNSQS